ncbi:MAG: hypothetical protein D6766_09240, partial [Verrucomicrobia bacterium]
VQVSLAPSDGLNWVSGPIPDSAAQLAQGESQTFTLHYQAAATGPVVLIAQAVGAEADGTRIFSTTSEATAFVGGKGDLLVQPFDSYNTFPPHGPPEPPKVLGDDSYAVRNPPTFTSYATHTNEALFALFVQNDSQAAASFILHAAETTDSDWQTRYQLDGVNVKPALLGEGVRFDNLAPGESRKIMVSFQAGPGAMVPDKISTLFELQLAGGNDQPTDSLRLQATALEADLRASLTAHADPLRRGFYDLELRVDNLSPNTMDFIQPLIDVGTEGPGNIRYLGQPDPFMVDALPPGASAVFHRALERLDDQPVRINARAVGHLHGTDPILSTLASVDLGEESDLGVALEPVPQRTPLGKPFEVRGFIANRSLDPLRLQPFAAADLTTTGDGALEVVQAELPWLERTLQPGERFPVTLVLNGTRAGDVTFTLQARALNPLDALVTATAGAKTAVISRGDLLIKAAREAPSFFAVNDQYQKAPFGAQYRKAWVSLTQGARFDVRIENDNPVPSAFVLQPLANPTQNWRIEYWQGEDNITSRFTGSDGFQTGELPPGGSLAFQIRVLAVNDKAEPQVFEWTLADAAHPEQPTDAVAVDVHLVSFPLSITLHRMTASGYTAASISPNNDVNAPLVPVTDPDLLAAQPEVTRGLVADGVTPLVLRIAPDPPEAIQDFDPDQTLEIKPEVKAMIGGYIDLPDIIYNTEIFSVLRDGVWEHVTSYQIAPVTLSRQQPAAFLQIPPIPSDAVVLDAGSTSVRVKLAFQSGDETLAEAEVAITKPPITLIHGYNTTGDWGVEALRIFRETREQSLVATVRYGVEAPGRGEFSAGQTFVASQAGSYLVNTVASFAELIPILTTAIRART